MNDLADYKRTNTRKKYVQDFPQGILDVIETDYPTTTLFSNEEWLDILTKSRNSYRGHIQQMNLTRKCSAQGN